MTPDPKPQSPDYPKYTKFIRSRRCAKTGRPGCEENPVVNCHQRQLHGAGTGMKPSAFHQLPLLNSVHQGEEHAVNGGYVFTREEAAIKCLAHEIIYLGLKATPFQMVQVIDLIGKYIKENKI